MKRKRVSLQPTERGTMTDPKSKIWTPTSPLDTNTQRMAWLLFLEEWKASIARNGPPLETEVVYDQCLAVAKIVRRLEQPEKHRVPTDEA